jgi:hypothetical protein
MEGNLSMTILDDASWRRGLQPFRAARTEAFQAWALERLVAFNCGSGDIRWAILALALRWSAAAWLCGQRRLVLLVRKLIGRDGEAGRFCGWHHRC